MEAIKEKSRYLLYAVLEMVLGIVLVVRPEGLTAFVIFAVGGILTILGIVYAVSWLMTAPEKAGTQHGLTKGLLCLMAGMLFLLHADWIQNVFPRMETLYGVMFALLCAEKIQWTVDFLRFRKYQWCFSLIGAVCALGMSVFLFLDPAWFSNILEILIPAVLITEMVLDILAVFYKGSMAGTEKAVRKTEKLNDEGWKFQKGCEELPKRFPSRWEDVTLPHTWNALDGQDGGGDYYRGKCAYAVRIPKQKSKGCVWLEIEAASLNCEVFLNGAVIAHHEGGYSAFRVDVTGLLKKRKNLLCIFVDNATREDVYPQMADFTFFGGLYRGVNLITVPESHFSLNRYGADGFLCTPISDAIDTRIRAETWLEHVRKQDRVYFTVTDREGVQVAQSEVTASEYVSAELHIAQPHFWQGVDDPYLYTVSAALLRGHEVIDEIEIKTGIRTFAVDPQKGFILNGKPMSLRGVSRHQDREDKGYAVSEQDHREDAALIREIGANTVRLAHYQHSRVFYEECDRLGLVVWAEIPLISVMSSAPGAHENSLQQMKELISQNYNHPSICFWGIANEITLGGDGQATEKNLRALNRLVHDMDPVRLTTMAQFTAYPMDGPLNQITDVLSYNHYMGWYTGRMEDNEAWLDAFHKAYPDRPLGLSEYGCEAVTTWHSDTPKRKDYTEEYQALYHEHMARIISERPWLWATHVWNMFDFAADSRDEGGVKGRNNKGLVTMDRRTKKDAFFLYKAWWSTEPFIHICGRRYAERTGDRLTLKIYSNQPEVTLYVDGNCVGKKTAARVFVFENLPFTQGSHTFTAKYGTVNDTIVLTGIEAENPAYHFSDAKEGDTVANWFEGKSPDEIPAMEFEEGYFSVKDTIDDLLRNPQAKDVFLAAVSSLAGMKVSEEMLLPMREKTVEDMSSILNGMAGDEADGRIRLLNAELQKIRRNQTGSTARH